MLELIRRCTQHFIKIDQEKRKVDVNIDYVISMEFLSLSRRRSSSQATQKGVGKDRWISLVFWATELDTSLSCSICQSSSLGRYRARFFKRTKKEKKLEIKAIMTTWSTKSKMPSRSQFLTDKKHCVAGRLKLFWRRVF